MLACFVGNADAAQHSRNFLDTLVRAEHCEHRSRRLAVRELRYTHVCMRLARNLREMRYAKHLRAVAQRAQLTSHDFRNSAAHASVDFVEDEAGQCIGL